MAISGIGYRGGFDPRVPFFPDNLDKPAPVLGRVIVPLSFTPFPLEEYLGLGWGVGSGEWGVGDRLAVDNLTVGRE